MKGTIGRASTDKIQILLAICVLKAEFGSRQSLFREISGGICTNLYMRQLIFAPDRANNEEFIYGR